jgi:hypothetical protein
MASFSDTLDRAQLGAPHSPSSSSRPCTPSLRPFADLSNSVATAQFIENAWNNSKELVSNSVDAFDAFVHSIPGKIYGALPAPPKAIRLYISICMLLVAVGGVLYYTCNLNGAGLTCWIGACGGLLGLNSSSSKLPFFLLFARHTTDPVLH